MNNQIAQITNNGMPPTVQPLATNVMFLSILPFVLILGCLIVMLITFLMHKKNKKVSLLIPFCMAVVSTVLVLFSVVALPFKAACDRPYSDCENIYMTGWERFVEYNVTNERLNITPNNQPEVLFTVL